MTFAPPRRIGLNLKSRSCCAKPTPIGTYRCATRFRSASCRQQTRFKALTELIMLGPCPGCCWSPVLTSLELADTWERNSLPLGCGTFLGPSPTSSRRRRHCAKDSVRTTRTYALRPPCVGHGRNQDTRDCCRSDEISHIVALRESQHH